MLQIKNNPKNGSGFDTLHQFGSWKVAFVTYAEQYGELKAVKRHLLTDETFVLINGSATLYTADSDKPLTKTELEKEKLYVVVKGTWHHLQVSENALLVVKKKNTQTKIVD
jgi:hypothetical protein